MQWCHGTFRITSSHPSCGGGVGLGLDMARAGARQHGHPTVSAEDLLSVNSGKKKKLVTELIVRLATPGVDTVVFSSLLRFLSTGEYPSQVRCAGAALSLANFSAPGDVPNLLEADLEHFYHTDCLLIFTGDKNNLQTSSPAQVS